MPAKPPKIAVKGKKPVCISFSSEISPSTASALQAALGNSVNNGHDEIHLFLSTPGGSVQEGITIYNFIRSLAVPVITYNVGGVNSIGNVVFQAAERRVSAIVSSFMFHGVGFNIQNARLEMKHLQERMQGIKSDQSLIADIMVRHTKLERDEVDRLFLEMAYLTANEAMKCGITDEVADIHLPKGMPILQLIFQ